MFFRMTKITKNNTQRTNAYQKVYTPENCRLEPQNWWFVGAFFLLQEGIFRFHVGFHGCTWTTNTPKHSMGLGVLCISPTNLPTKKKTTLKSCKTKTGWWLNQPIWKICSSKWVHLPQGSGVKIKKCLSCHHLEKISYQRFQCLGFQLR